MATKVHTSAKNYRKARAMVRKSSCESVYLRMPFAVAQVMLKLLNQRDDELAIKAQRCHEFQFRDAKAYRFWVYNQNHAA